MNFGHAQVPAHWNAASVDKAAAFRLFEREVLCAPSVDFGKEPVPPVLPGLLLRLQGRVLG
jgi:hypothetical protein